METTQTSQQQAYAFVKERILNLVYKPGEFVTDTKIAEQLAISRTPVREAFYKLEHEGLLVNEVRRGWRVYSLSIGDLHDIFDVKVAVEGMVARRAAECTDERLRDALQAAVQHMRDAVAVDDRDDWLTADFELHDVLFEMVPNAYAHRIILNLNDQWHRLRIGFAAVQGRIERSTEEHERFVSAILTGDGDTAQRHMEEHLTLVRDELIRLLENMVLPFAGQGV